MASIIVRNWGIYKTVYKETVIVRKKEMKNGSYEGIDIVCQEVAKVFKVKHYFDNRSHDDGKGDF